MTKILNLESYVDCYQYALLFQEQPENLSPKIAQLPRIYKEFVQEATNNYIPNIINDELCSQDFVLNTELNYLTLGELASEDERQLFIIRDTVDLMTLSNSGLFNRHDTYLYSSAYHYWDNYSEINQHHIRKPLVIINLDSCLPSHLIPINISQIEGSHYQIPVLNTNQSLSVDFNFDAEEVYKNICQNVAQLIIEHHFPTITQNSATVDHLTHYLQKIAFFRIIQPYVHQESFEIIVEILHQNHIYYKKVALSTQAIADIVKSQVHTSALNQIALNYPEYQFILTSQFNIFPDFCNLLPNIICPSATHPEFRTIWQARNQLKFPLFGIYLDKIEFAINISNDQGQILEQWIELTNQGNNISYEGKPTTLIGRIHSNNSNVFSISSQQTSTLPIKVNGSDYCRDGIPQDYSIKIKNSQTNEKVLIRIEFHLQPGSSPELKVIDLAGKYNVITSLVDRKITKKLYNHISPERIINDRQHKSNNQIRKLQNSRNAGINDTLIAVADKASALSMQTHIKYNLSQVTSLLKQARQSIHRNNNNLDLLQFVDNSSSDAVVACLNTRLQNSSYQKIMEFLVEKLNVPNVRNLSQDERDFIAEAIMFIGKTYKFSHNFLDPALFSSTKLNLAHRINHKNTGNELFHCLARTAISKANQHEYFSWFDSFYKIEGSKYLWGYSRILLWYYDFNSSSHTLNYKAHFVKILDYLLSKSSDNFNLEYKQNAFLSLLYLLTFRAIDKAFCEPDSVEIYQAKRVMERFQNDKIMFNSLSKEKSLNQFFQEMIEGNSTEDDLVVLVQAN